MTGTEWTEPGKGATVKEVWAVSMAQGVCGDWQAAKAAAALHRRERFSGALLTNLRLTGLPLTAEDLDRISKCEVSR